MTTRTESVPTPAGEARVTWHPATAGKARLVLAVSHGAGGGIEARDLRALAAALPARGITVALVEQPWRVAGKKVAAAPKVLDEGWRGLWPALTRPGPPVVAGGRSAGARVACRTAAELGAAGVLALAFPLHPPGRPEKSRAQELLGAGRPTLVVQGSRDRGRPVRTRRGGARRPRVRRAEEGRPDPGRDPRRDHRGRRAVARTAAAVSPREAGDECARAAADPIPGAARRRESRARPDTFPRDPDHAPRGVDLTDPGNPTGPGNAGPGPSVVPNVGTYGKFVGGEGAHDPGHQPEPSAGR